MVHTILLRIVKAVRFRYAALFVLLLVGVYLLVIHPWMKNWGSSAAEQQMALPGDEMLSKSAGHNTLAITINASSDVVWKWLVQISQDRGGFYTYTWLENIFGTDIHNADETHPEWQQIAAGDGWRLVPPDYLWGMGKEMVSPVLISEPGYALVVEMFGAHVLAPIDGKTTRLIVRGEAPAESLLGKLVWEPIVFTLSRRMLLGLKARAEGRPDAPAALMAIAQLGWAATGVTVAGLFLSQRRRWFWLALPVLAGLPALLTSSDLQAALAAFIASGIILLGFLSFGRSWWGPLLVVGSVVMLTLLLAPEAYSAFGLGFVLLLLAGLGVTLAGRTKTVGDAVVPLAAPPANP